MSIYLVGAIDRTDLETYKKYETEGLETIVKFGAEGLAVCDAPVLIEGQLPGKRMVIMKFKDQAALDQWYNSPEYQKVLPLRHQSSTTNFLVAVEGLD